MSDPLDAVFVTGNESAELKRAATARALAAHLARMPAELRAMFGEQFQHITSAELAQLRAYAAEAQAAHVYLDESHVNGNADDMPVELVDRIVLLVRDVIALRATVAALEQQLEVARPFAQYVSQRALWTESRIKESADNWLAANASQEGG